MRKLTRFSVGPALVIFAMLVASCGSDGRDYAVPAQTDLMPTELSPSSEPIPLVQAGPDSMMIASPAFAAGVALPLRFTITDQNLSPSLAFTDLPPQTAELALIVTDPAVPFVHWLVTGIPGDTPSIGEGSLPDGAIEHANDAADLGWHGPNVADGAAGQLQFELFAFEVPLKLADTDQQPEVIDRIRLDNIGRAAFTTPYGTVG